MNAEKFMLLVNEPIIRRHLLAGGGMADLPTLFRHIYCNERVDNHQ
jgi:hypothetical protein